MIRDPTVTQPENSASDATPFSNTSPAKGKAEGATTGTTVPNRALEGQDADGAAQTTSAQAADSLLVGTPLDPSREAAARKDKSQTERSSVPPVSGKAAPKEPAKTGVTAADSTSQAGTPATGQPVIVETKTVEIRKAGFFPMVLGGVIAAGLGAGAAYYAIPHLPAAWQPIAAQDPQAQLDATRAIATQAGQEAAKAEFADSRPQLLSEASAAAIDAVQKAQAEAKPDEASTEAGTVALGQMRSELDQQSDQIAALTSALDALRTPTAPTGTAPLGSTAGLAGDGLGGDGAAGNDGVDAAALQAVQSMVAQLRSQVEAQESRIAELAARPVGDANAAEQVQALTAQASEMQSKIAAAAEQAQSQIASAQAEAERVKQETSDIGRRAQIAAAAAGLQVALDSGGNLAGGVADLRAAGIEPPAALNADVPALSYLQRDFDEAARAGLRAALKAQSQGEGAMGAIGNFLRVQTGARSVEAKDGTDPDAILSRAGAAVRMGDIATALTEISTLPAPGQQAMSGWTTKAKLWTDARAALAELAATAK